MTAIHIGVIVLVGGVLYANSLSAPFVFDDHQHIRENRFVHMQRFDLQDFYGAAVKSPDAKRPVANISFALNHVLGGLDVVGYHAVNIAVHIINGVLVYVLASITFRLWTQSPRRGRSVPGTKLSALATALLFTAHPLQIQSVTYIVQRMNSMAVMFMLLALLLYIRGRLGTGGWRRGAIWALGAAAWVMALGCKPVAATLPLTILLYDLYFFRRSAGQSFRWWRFMPESLVLVAAALVVIFLGPDPFASLVDVYVLHEFTLPQRLLTQFRVLVFYGSLLLFPHPSRLNLLHDIHASRSLVDPITTLISLGLIALLIVVAIVTARRFRVTSFCIV